MYTVASPDTDHDPNPRGGGQLPNPNEFSSTLMSATSGETLTPYVSVNSKPDYPPGDSHILVVPGVVFSLLCLARGSARGFAREGGLNQSKSSIILKKSTIFALSLKQLSSSSFHMFIYARSEQRDLVPIFTITNTQRIRIYQGKLKFILVKISSGFSSLFYRPRGWEF